jgi:hypothetical protein
MNKIVNVVRSKQFAFSEKIAIVEYNRLLGAAFIRLGRKRSSCYRQRFAD